MDVGVCRCFWMLDSSSMFEVVWRAIIIQNNVDLRFGWQERPGQSQSNLGSYSDRLVTMMSESVVIHDTTRHVDDGPQTRSEVQTRLQYNAEESSEEGGLVLDSSRTRKNRLNRFIFILPSHRQIATPQHPIGFGNGISQHKDKESHSCYTSTPCRRH